MARSTDHLKAAQSAHDASLAMGASCSATSAKAARAALTKSDPARQAPTTTSAPNQPAQGGSRTVSGSKIPGAATIPGAASTVTGQSGASPKGKTPGQHFDESDAAVDAVAGASDAAHAQQLHEHAVALGAACMEKHAGGPLAKDAEALALVKAAHRRPTMPFYGHRA